MKQFKILSYATQNAQLMYQIESARQITVIVFPVYNEGNKHWKYLLNIMSHQQQLGERWTKPLKKYTMVLKACQ